MINILMHVPNRHDATAYYRAAPLMALRKSIRTRNGQVAPGYRAEEINLDFAGEVSFLVAKNYDLAFFQRPSTDSELQAIRIFKRLGIPVIVDYDDLLFDIPQDNPAYSAYMNKHTQETIITIIREASCVWVSTKELKRCLQIPKAPLNEKVYVVHNALDDTHLVRGERRLPQARRQPSVLWRGSQTHERDVMEYTTEIADIAKAANRHSFVFAGWNPWFLTEMMRKKQAIVSGPLPVGEFMDFIYATGSQIGIVPLHDSRFNRCKSNIAWLEMTWGGGAVLAPDWEEWRMPGITTYSNQEDFKAGLASLVESPVQRLAELNKMSWDHIENNYFVSKVNTVRWETILSTVRGEGWPDGWQLIHDDDVVMELE